MPISPKREGYDFWEKTLGKPRLLVAPMVDQSELAWRLLSRRHGAQLCYTPMFHAAVFARDPHYRSEALASCPEDKPLIVQFSANDPDDFLRAALLAQDHCDAVDLNLGCPQANAKKGRYGAFLQEDWDAIFNIVSLANKRLSVPVTCKIRIFEEVSKTVEYAKMLERAGCQMLTVHGRTRDMKGPKTGLANWDVIKAVKQNLSIPVFANGNIQYLSDVERCIEETGVDGIMTAEGNLYNPALFEGVQPPAWEMAEEYLQLVQEYPCPMAFVRGHLFKLWHHSLTVHHDLRARMASAKTLDDFINVSQDLRRVCEEEAKQGGQDDSKGISHWRCQPYIRPTPEETEKRKLEKSLKRPLSEENEQENQVPFMSKKALKKLKQWGKLPNKRGRQFDPCGTCSNPRGLSCVFKLCRACCKDKARKAVEDCPSHRFLFKTKIERRKYWEAQQAAKALETHTQLPTEHPRRDLTATQTTIPSDLTATQTTIPSDLTATQTTIPSDLTATQTTIPSDLTATQTTIPSDLTATQTTIPSDPTATLTDMPSDLTTTPTDMPSDLPAEMTLDRVESEHVSEDTNDERAPSGGLLTVPNTSSAVS